MSFVAVLLASGQSLRFGDSLPKQFLPIRLSVDLELSLLELSFLAVTDHVLIDKCVLLLPQNLSSSGLFIKSSLLKYASFINFDLICLVGGDTRQRSVFLALEHLFAYHASKDYDFAVCIHDSARPLLDKQDLNNLLYYYQQNHKPCILAKALKDTAKVINHETGFIENTLNRDLICLAETPQLFVFEMIWQAHLLAQQSNHQATDDASLLEASHPINIIYSKYLNFKITHGIDLELCQLFLQKKLQTDIDFARRVYRYKELSS